MNQCDNSCFNSKSCVYRVMYRELQETVLCPCTDCIIKMICNSACENYGVNRKRLSVLKVRDHNEYYRILSVSRTENELFCNYEYYLSKL